MQKARTIQVKRGQAGVVKGLEQSVQAGMGGGQVKGRGHGCVCVCVWTEGS